MSPAGDVPQWAQAVCGVLLLLGALLALVGAVGVLRLPAFFQRVHASTLASTLGAWAIAAAGALYLSFTGDGVTLRPLLVPALLALTVPVSTFFLMRAAVFRARLAGERGVPGNMSAAGGAPDAGAETGTASDPPTPKPQ